MLMNGASADCFKPARDTGERLANPESSKKPVVSSPVRAYHLSHMKISKLLLAAAFAFMITGATYADAPCCERAKAQGRQCDHPCCIKAKAEGRVCEKCNKVKAPTPPKK
jgi:hypothetical protein